MALSINQTIILRDKLHNLNIDNLKEHRNIYENYRFKYLSINEGIRNQAYDDGAGNITVGIGFNMSRGDESKSEWEEAFKNTELMIPFDQIFNKERTLSNEEVRILFDYSISMRETEIKNIYNDIWPLLKGNERLTIEDCYYNKPNLVRKHTNFYKYIAHYITTSDENLLIKAADDLQHNSIPYNTKIQEGIQNRRNSQATLLLSHECPMYSKPNQDHILSSDELNKPFHPVINNTIIPRNIYSDNKWYPNNEETEYFIYRAHAGDEIKPGYYENDGKILLNNLIYTQEEGQFDKEPLPIGLTIV